MKALVYTEPFRFSYTDFPDPEPGPRDVIVRVQACGICGSDVHGYTGSTGRRLPPLIMGHEAAGIVESVGQEVSTVEPGERVCFDSTVYCNQCPACWNGNHNRCEHRQVLGVSIPGMKRHGAFAERVVLPFWTVIPMPEDLSFVQAALLEPVSIGLHAAGQGEVTPGDTVLVIGAGPIGLFTLQAARLRGAGRVIVSDPSEHRLELARQVGADETVNPKQVDLERFVHDQTGGRGVDVSFEVVGFAETLRQAVAATRIGGRVVLVGNLTRTVEVNIQEVISRELTLRGSYASSGEYRDAIDLVASGRIDVRPLVSAVLPLSRGQECFDRLHAGSDDLVKIVLQPDSVL